MYAVYGVLPAQSVANNSAGVYGAAYMPASGAGAYGVLGSAKTSGARGSGGLFWVHTGTAASTTNAPAHPSINGRAGLMASNSDTTEDIFRVYDNTTLVASVADGGAFITGSAVGAANAVSIQETAGQITFEGATSDTFQTRVTERDPTADNTITLPDGTLGAGKTTLVRGVLHALGYDGRVKSPTYTLIDSYPVPQADRELHHLDLYRLASPDEVTGLALRDLPVEDWLLIEWPEKRTGALPPADLVAYLEHAGTGRVVSFDALTPVGRVVVDKGGL